MYPCNVFMKSIVISRTTIVASEYYWLPRCWLLKGECIGQQCDVENDVHCYCWCGKVNICQQCQLWWWKTASSLWETVDIYITSPWALLHYYITQRKYTESMYLIWGLINSPINSLAMSYNMLLYILLMTVSIASNIVG